MTHLVIHLVEELDICGSIRTRWTYPMERYMKAMKEYVRKMARLEENMSMGYSLEEALGFCTKYIQEVKSTWRVWDDKEEAIMHDEILEVNGCPQRLIVNLLGWAHTFVLHNATTTKPWCK